MSKQVKIANQEATLARLKSNLEDLTEEETDLQKSIDNYQPPPKLEADHRYELVAPPNALYSDKVICAFLFCPICVTISGGEFSSVEEAKEHVKMDPLHLKIIKEGGKRFTDRLKCSRCRICGVDIFGGNDIISHLLSDTHRLNYVAMHDANNPSLLNNPLNDIETEDLEQKLVDQIKVMFEEMKEEQARIRMEEEKKAAAKNKNNGQASNKRKNGKGGGTTFSDTLFIDISKEEEENLPVGKKKKKENGAPQLTWTRLEGSQANQKTGTPTAPKPKLLVKTDIPYTTIKLSKPQKKKGWKGVAELWTSPPMKAWLAQHMKFTPDQIAALYQRFPLPYIYSKLHDAGPDGNCWITETKFAKGTMGTDLQKIAHINSKEHAEACQKWPAKIRAMFNFPIPNQVVTMILCYDPVRDKVLQNWNSMIAYLEITPGLE